MADPQKKHVYRWEKKQGWDRPSTSFRNCVAAIERACRRHGVPVAHVRRHATGLSWSQPEDNVISMSREEYNIPIALHEVAHHIAWYQKGYRIQDHGPYFVSLYLGLLEQARVGTLEQLQQSARREGLRWA